MNALRKRNLPSSPHLPLTSKLSETEMKILKEVAIMKKLRHPHVVRLLEVMDDHLVKDIYLGKHHCGCIFDHVFCARLLCPPSARLCGTTPQCFSYASSFHLLICLRSYGVLCWRGGQMANDRQSTNPPCKPNEAYRPGCNPWFGVL